MSDEELSRLVDVAHVRLSKADQEAGYRLDGAMALHIRDVEAKRCFAMLVDEVIHLRASAVVLSDEERQELSRHIAALKLDGARNDLIVALLSRLLATTTGGA